MAVNFNKDLMTRTPSTELAELGYYMGCALTTKLRITVEFGPKKFRRDMPKGTCVFFQGHEDGEPIVRFTTDINNENVEADAKVKKSNLLVFRRDPARHHRSHTNGPTQHIDLWIYAHPDPATHMPRRPRHSPSSLPAACWATWSCAFPTSW